MTKHTQQAHSVIAAGAIPARLHGAAAYGMSAAELKRCRAQFAEATAVVNVSACVQTRIVLLLGRRGDPHYQYITDVIKGILDLLQEEGPGNSSQMRMMTGELSAPYLSKISWAMGVNDARGGCIPNKSAGSFTIV